jgi:hypothetical protein
MNLHRFYEEIGPFLLGRRSHEEVTRALWGEGRSPRQAQDAARLSIYGRMCRAHRHEALTVFQYVREDVQGLLGTEGWDALVEDYFVAHPMRHFELNRNGEPFPDFVEGLVGSGKLPGYLGELAGFEWREWLATSAPDDEPETERPRLGNAVDIQRVTFDLLAYVKEPAGVREKQGPGPRTGYVLFWRDGAQETRREWASAMELVVIKAVVEGRAIDGELAEETGMGREDLEETLEDLRSAGIVI